MNKPNVSVPNGTIYNNFYTGNKTFEQEAHSEEWDFRNIILRTAGRWVKGWKIGGQIGNRKVSVVTLRTVVTTYTKACVQISAMKKQRNFTDGLHKHWWPKSCSG